MDFIEIQKVGVTPIEEINGAIVNSKNIADKTTNTYSAEIIDGLIEEEKTRIDEKVEITQIPWTDIMYMKEGFTCLEAFVFKDRNRYFGNIVVYSSGGFSNSTVIGFLKPMLGVSNTGCFLTFDQWNAQAVGYCYMGTDQIIVSDSSGQRWTVAKIKFDLVSAY